MEAIIQYIYTGETYIAKDDLFSFLNTANLLQIIGLINYNSSSSSSYDDGGDNNNQNGTYGHHQHHHNHHHHSNEYNNNQGQKIRMPNSSGSGGSNSSGSTTAKTGGIVVKKFAHKTDECNKSRSPPNPDGIPSKKKHGGRVSDGDTQQSGESPAVKSAEENCPILSKQLLLPKKRKLSVVDQNKNEFYDNSELSNSSEDLKDSGTILRNCLESEKQEGEKEVDDECPPPLSIPTVMIKKETVESDNNNVLEPEVGLCVKEEQEFESASEESSHNGDILLQRLQASQGLLF